METRAHHVLIGAFAIAALVIGLGFVLWLSKVSADREFGYYNVVFTEAVTGLSKGGLVQYNGIKVGEVVLLKLAPDDPRKVVARIRVDGDTPIKEDTIAKLGLQGVTGVAFIQLSGGAPTSKPLLPTKAEPVPTIRSEQSAISKLMASGEDIVTSVNDALVRIGQVLSKENVDHVNATLQHFDEIASTVAAQREDLGKALNQLADASGQLKSTLHTLNDMANTTNELIRDDARHLLKSAEVTLASIDRLSDATGALVTDNRAAINSFSNQGLRQVGPTLTELRETLKAVKQLSGDLGRSSSVLLGNDQPKEFRPQ